MWILSVDVETTGLNPQTCDVIQFGCVLDNTEWWSVAGTWEKLPVYETIVRPGYYVDSGLLRGEPYALQMNHAIIKRLASGEGINTWDLGETLKAFLILHGMDMPSAGKPIGVTAAGKNFGSFDLQFLKWVAGFEKSIKFAHRSLDVGSLYFDPTLDTDKLPDLATCLGRAKLPSDVAHTALADARTVAALVRLKFGFNPYERTY